MSNENLESFVNWKNFEKVFKSGPTPERTRFQRAIDYARNVTTTDLHAFKNLQEVFDFVLLGYVPINPFDQEELGITARERMQHIGRSGAYDYRAIFDILASARYANRKLQIADEQTTRLALTEHRQKKGEVMARLQTRDKNEHKYLTAQHEIARIIEQYIVNGKLGLVSDPITTPSEN